MLFQIILLAVAYTAYIIFPTGAALVLPFTPFLILRILSADKNNSWHALAFSLVVVFSALIVHPILPAYFITAIIIPSVIMFFFYKKNPEISWIPITFAPVPFIILILSVFLLVPGLYGALHDDFMNVLNEYIQNSGGTELTTEYTYQLTQMFEFMLTILPAVMYGVIAVLYYFTERIFYFRTQATKVTLFPLHDALLAFVVLVALLKVYGVSTGIHTINLVGLNGIVMLMVLYFLRGLDIVTYYFNRWRVPIFLRIFMYLVLFTRFLFISVAILGFVSVFKNLIRGDDSERNA